MVEAWKLGTQVLLVKLVNMNELLAQVHYSIVLLGPEMLIVYYSFLVLLYWLRPGGWELEF